MQKEENEELIHVAFVVAEFLSIPPDFVLIEGHALPGSVLLAEVLASVEISELEFRALVTAPEDPLYAITALVFLEAREDIILIFLV